MIELIFKEHIIKGKRVFDEVPESMKEKVADLLVSDGYGHLVTGESAVDEASSGD